MSFDNKCHLITNVPIPKETAFELQLELELIETRRERLKSAPYLRLKKRKTLFLEKIEIFEKKFSFKRSRIVPKNVKGGPFWIY